MEEKHPKMGGKQSFPNDARTNPNVRRLCRWRGPVGAPGSAGGAAPSGRQVRPRGDGSPRPALLMPCFLLDAQFHLPGAYINLSAWIMSPLRASGHNDSHLFQ